MGNEMQTAPLRERGASLLRFKSPQKRDRYKKVIFFLIKTVVAHQ